MKIIPNTHKTNTQRHYTSVQWSDKTKEYHISEKDFEPLRMLGMGSFGDVYLVRYIGNKNKSKSQGPLYAMKAINKSHMVDDPDWLRYIITERDVLAQSDNPFITKLRWAFQTKTKLFLIIDFCPGGDL